MRISDQALRIKPDSGEALVNRGSAYKNKSEFDRAIVDFTNAFATDTLNSLGRRFGFFNRGNAFLAKGDRDRAIADFDQAITLDPKFAAAYHVRGKAYQAKGDLDRAIADFDQAVALAPKFADAYFSRGLVYQGIVDSTMRSAITIGLSR